MLRCVLLGHSSVATIEKQQIVDLASTLLKAFQM